MPDVQRIDGGDMRAYVLYVASSKTFLIASAASVAKRASTPSSRLRWPNAITNRRIALDRGGSGRDETNADLGVWLPFACM